MDFRSPVMTFWLIPFAGLIVLHVLTRLRRRRDLARLGESKLLLRLVSRESLKRRIWKDRFSLAGLLFLLVALIGPQWGHEIKDVRRRGVDVFIAVDVSRSMLAEDVAPSRLERAKQSLSYLIQKLKGNRVGIIAFARYAAVQCPLTVDTEAARLFLSSLNTDLIPQQGTAIGDAIRLATNRFNKEDKAGKAIIVLTDGEDHQSDPLGAAKEAKEKGIAVFTIGIGTAKGEVIKKRDEQGRVIEFLKHKGDMVLSRLDDALLSKMAAVANGKYFRSSSSDQEIDEIAEILNGFDKKELGQGLHRAQKDRFQWPATVALFLLLFEFLFSERPRQLDRIKNLWKDRRFHFSWRKTAPAIFALILMPSLLFADAADHLRKGNKLLKKGDTAGARAEYESALIDDPDSPIATFNLGTAYLLEGNFEEAKKRLEQAQVVSKDPDMQSRAAYNRGYADFFKGERAAAIEGFKEALRLNPKDQDARYNIEYLMAGKNPPAPPKQQPSGSPSPQENKQDKQDGKGGQSNKAQNAEKKDEQLSKEDAERVLQMIQDQEKEDRQKSKPISIGNKDKKDENENVEDW